ncbi:MAG: ribonuclease R [Alphaproteobacteria bacterium]|jgi:ribonuclease R
MANKAAKLPSQDEIIAFLKTLDGKAASKREIAKNFHIKGQEARVDLKFMLKEMILNGLIENDKVKTFRLPGTEIKETAKVAPMRDNVQLNVIGKTDDGEMVCEPVNQNLKADYPLIVLDLNSKATIGDTLTAELHPMNDGEFMAKEVKTAKKHDDSTIMGVYRERVDGPAKLIALSKELSKLDFVVPSLPKGSQIKDGSVVTAKVGKRPQYGPTPVEIVEVISSDIKGSEVAIAIRNHEIPHQFPENVTQFAKDLKPVNAKDLEGREDLRHIPIVTIDGEDAKDFDDAVWAEAWESDKVKNGFHIIVAIADVAHYVKEGSILDKEAFTRGNSTYFPGHVIPMLPEELSNDLCSLRPHEDRPVMVAHMYINEHGKLLKYNFTRAVIHSHARLTYNQVQEALNGEVPETVKPVMYSTIKPLHQAFKALLQIRSKRGALDLDVPETVICMDDDGEITAIEKRSRFESHQLIEEMMVLANVAAASQLETKSAPCLYRIHPEPGEVKVEALAAALKDFGLNLSLADGITPLAIQRTLNNARDEHKDALYMTVLRSLEQARYDPQNVGHFGLALERYAHFTSPIRRYSDLIVHRSLISNLKLSGHAEIPSPSHLVNTADHLCITERRSQKAEWEVKDRLSVRYYIDFIDKEFVARITGLTKFGMFVAVDDGAAEGMLPYRFMNDDHYIFDEKTITLKGRKNGTSYKIGGNIDVALIESDAVTGRITFAPKGMTSEDAAKLSRRPPRGGKRGGKPPRRDDKSYEKKFDKKRVPKRSSK